MVRKRRHRWGPHPLWKKGLDALQNYQYCPNCITHRARRAKGHSARAWYYWLRGFAGSIRQDVVPPCKRKTP